MQINQLFFLGHNKYGQGGLGQCQHNKHFSQVKRFLLNTFIKQVSCGGHHSAFLTIDGCLYTAGSHTHGALGIAHSSTHSLHYSFNPIFVMDNVSTVQCGSYHTCAIVNHALYSWGKGIDGQLGLNNTKNANTPQLVAINQPVVSVSCGGSHTIVLTQKRNVFAFGNGIFGQLATGSNRNCSTPTLCKINAVESVSAGQNHTLFLKQGAVYGCGDNTLFQLSSCIQKKYVLEPTILPLAQACSVVQAKRISAALGLSGTIYTWGGESVANNNSISVIICQMSQCQHIVDIKLNNEDVFALTSVGALYVWHNGVRQTLLKGGDTILDFAMGGTHGLIVGDIVGVLPCETQVPQMLHCVQDVFSRQMSNRSIQSMKVKELRQKHSLKSIKSINSNDNAHTIPNDFTDFSVMSSVEHRVPIPEETKALKHRHGEQKQNYYQCKKQQSVCYNVDKQYMKENVLREIDCNQLKQNCALKQKPHQQQEQERKIKDISFIKNKLQRQNSTKNIKNVKNLKNIKSENQQNTFVNNNNELLIVNHNKSIVHFQNIKDKAKITFLKQDLIKTQSSKHIQSQNKIDRIMEVLTKNANKSQKLQQQTLTDNRTNRTLRNQLMQKQLKISQLQETLSRKQMQIEAQRELIKVLRQQQKNNAIK